MTGYSAHHAKYLAHRITLAGHGEDSFAKSFSTARVDMKPHQVEAALFALQSPLSKGVILADEVGLGKTIEASLVIAQRWAERRRHILLVVPASLRKQWSQELHEKFSLPSRILDAKTHQDLVKRGVARPFLTSDEVVITSYEFAARRSADITTVPWDLVVFDEAHRLRNVYKQTGSARAKQLKEALTRQFKILLTATPLQNSLMELYGLVGVIDDDFFGDEATFRTMYAGSRADRLSLGSLRQRLQPIYKRHLRRDVQEAGHVSFTKRIATTFDFEPGDQEASLYDAVSLYLQRPDTYGFGLNPNQLVIMQARKILGSSVAAIEQFLANVIARLEKSLPADLSAVNDDRDPDDIREEARESDAITDSDDAAEPPPIDPEKLKAEIAELAAYKQLAATIGKNAKGEKLVARLPEVLDKVVGLGGKRKAVIFTESVRTQNYLAHLLSENGYAGQIVLLNGSNSDKESGALYRDWLARHKGNAKAVSGSKSADMKQAIVDGFKSDGKTILIATESGAEGINLQFCSLLINFDLPWNPQRVEQRIGRCHRYGQRIDVTVVNMLNRKNRAEERVYELLDQKFKLFEGVFGVSDTVLGAIESGFEFERKVVEAVQRCRSDAQVEEAFKKIEQELEDSIKEDMADARKRLFDVMDRDVVARLRARDAAITGTLDAFKQRLLTIVKAELPDARFHDGYPERFDYQGETYTTEWPLADEMNWHFFRFADGALARTIVDRAKDRGLAPTKLSFAYEAYRVAGNARLSAIEGLIGKSGWLQVALLKAETAKPDANRERLLVAGFCDDGTSLDADLVDRLMMVPADVNGALTEPVPIEQLAKLEAKQKDATLAEAQAENMRWLDEETDKLDAAAEDLEKALETRLKEMKRDIDAAKRAFRAMTNVTLEQKVAEQRRIKRLEDERRQLKLSLDAEIQRISDDKDKQLDEIARLLAITPTVTPLMTIRWEMAV